MAAVRSHQRLHRLLRQLPVAGYADGVPVVSAELALDCKCGTGEAVFWDAAAKLVRFLDIPGRRLFALDPADGSLRTWETPEQPGTFVQCAGDPETFVVAFETGFYLYHPETKGMSKIGGEIDNRNGGRLNDGRCDRQGRLICGGFNEPGAKGWEKQQGVYQVAGSAVKPMALTPSGRVACANGTCFSPDGRTMYFCDTPDRVIWAYDYDPATGAASSRRDFADFAKLGLPGLPDGATVDAEGGIWTACFFGGAVVRLTPDGWVSYVVKVPTRFPTCPAFCGEDLDVLYITSGSGNASQEDRAKGGKEEHAGSLFRIKVPFRGLPEPKFVSG